MRVVDNIEATFNLYRARQAIKVGVASMIAILIVAWFHIPSGFMVLLPISVISTVFPNEIFNMAFERLFGALLAALVGMVILAIAVDYWWLAAILFSLALFIAAQAMLRHVLHYTMVMFIITLAVIYLLSYTAPDKGIAFGWQWTLNIALGIVILLVVDAIAFAKSRRHDYYRMMRHYCQLSAAGLEQDVQIHDQHQVAIQQIQTVLKASQSQMRKVEYQRQQRYVVAVEALLQQWSELNDWHQQHRHYPEIESIVAEPVQRCLEAIKTLLQQLEHVLQQADGTVECEVNAIAHAVDAVERAIAKAREQQAFASLPTEAAYGYLSLLHHLKRITNVSRRFLNSTPALQAAAHTQHASFAVLSIKAFKVALTVLGTLWLTVTTGWAGVVQPMISATVAAVQPNLGKATRQILDRMLGLAIGSLVGVVYAMLLSQVPQLWLLMCLYFLGLASATYVGLGSSRYSYVGLQAGVALTLVLTIDSSVLVPTLSIIGQRIIGVFEGFLVAMIVLYLLWPDNPVKTIRLKQQQLYQKTAKLWRDLEQKVVSQQYGQEVVQLVDEMNAISEHLLTVAGGRTTYQHVLQQQPIWQRWVQLALMPLDDQTQIDWSSPMGRCVHDHFQRQAGYIEQLAQDKAINSTQLTNDSAQLDQDLTAMRHERLSQSWTEAVAAQFANLVIVLQMMYALLMKTREQNENQSSL